MLFKTLQQLNVYSRRPMFRWLVTVFNNYSEKRVQEVGPDIACAEWLMRNGAAVKWRDAKTYQNNYDALPSIDKSTVGSKAFIHGVDATDSGISHEGFPHFSGCKYIEEIKLINCLYIGNQALELLNLVRASLKYLEISNCGNVTDKGLESLKNLSQLEILKLENLNSVKDKNNVVVQLKKALPNCQIVVK